jgi:hypothetical protein
MAPTQTDAAQPLLAYNLCLPNEVCIFSVPRAGIRRWDDAVVVYDVRIGDRLLRHYSFARRWFVINCTLDLEGGFLAEPGPIDWCFNCDISSPHLVQDGVIYTVDLALDVLVAPDGRQHVVVDQDEYDEAVRHGWLTAGEQAGAQHGLAELLSIIRADGLAPFLSVICPFQPGTDLEPQPPPGFCQLDEVPPFGLAARRRRHG